MRARAFCKPVMSLLAAAALLAACQNPLQEGLARNTAALDIASRVAINGVTTIEAENYSAMSGVQLEACSEGTQNIGWIDSGDWMVYPLSIATAGKYTVEYRVASPSGGTLTADLNAGTTQLGQLVIPASGGWQTWKTVSQTVTLPAGTVNFGIFAVTGGWNLNWIRISPANSTPVVSTVTLQGEAASFAGGSFANGDNAIVTAGSTLTWNGVNMNGVTKVSVHYSNGEPGGDTITLHYAGAQLGGAMTIANHTIWTGPYTSVSTSFAASSGTGSVSIKGNGANWIAAVDRIVLEGTGIIDPVDPEDPVDPVTGTRDPVAFNESQVSSIVNSGKIALMLADNSSEYNLADVYVAVIGRSNGVPSWYDIKNGVFRPINDSYNTIVSPKANDPWKYANIFTRISEISNATIPMPKISAGKMFVAFKKPVYIHFFNDGGYAPPSLAAGEADPSYGIRFEVLEFTWDDIAIWVNTSRVDAYQYAMGLEVWGTHNAGKDSSYIKNGGMDYKRAGEIISHTGVMNRWNSRVSAPFLSCLVNRTSDGPIIEQPSKIAAFKEGGQHVDFFKGYIDTIWNTFATRDLLIRTGEHDNTTVWVGRVINNKFEFYQQSNPGRKATIYGRPSTQDVIEGKGFLAYTPVDPLLSKESKARFDDDLQMQAQICAAITRAVIDVNSTAIQDNHLASSYFKRSPHNEYVSFFHNAEVSHQARTYAFCYDDVGDHSSTIVFTNPRKIRLDIGGFFDLKLP